MLYREKNSFFSQIDTKHKHAVWAARKIVNVKPGGTYNNHWALQG